MRDWSLLRHCTRLNYSVAVSAQSYQSVIVRQLYHRVVQGGCSNIDVSNIYKRADPWVCSGRDAPVSALQSSMVTVIFLRGRLRGTA